MGTSVNALGFFFFDNVLVVAVLRVQIDLATARIAELQGTIDEKKLNGAKVPLILSITTAFLNVS